MRPQRTSRRPVTAPADLAGLLASGEHAAFHGKPAAAVGVLEQAVVLAQSQGRAAEMAAAGWLLGVALGAGGRYGGALTVLSPLIEAAGRPTPPPSTACSARSPPRPSRASTASSAGTPWPARPTSRRSR